MEFLGYYLGVTSDLEQMCKYNGNLHGAEAVNHPVTTYENQFILSCSISKSTCPFVPVS
jgi:hypothetical protein